MTRVSVRRVAVAAGLALLVSGCGAADLVGNVQQCAQVGAAVAQVSLLGVGQASGQDLTAAGEALGDVSDVPEALRGAFDTLTSAFAAGQGLDDPAVSGAYEEIRAWAEQECVPGSLGDLVPGK